MNGRFERALVAGAALLCATLGLGPAMLPDGRMLTPVGFTVPVEGFASAQAISPDGRWIAVVGGGGADAVDIIGTRDSVLRERLATGSPTALAWSADGLYVGRGYTGTVARYAYDAAASKAHPVLKKLVDVQVSSGLIGGVADDAATHRLAVTRTADREVIVFDDESGAILERHATDGQPFAVGFAGGGVIATLYDSDHVQIWRGPGQGAIDVATGPHPTAMTVDGERAYVSDADGHDVAVVDVAGARVERRYDLGLAPDAPPGQTPAGLALATDRQTLFVTESGFNDVAVVDTGSGRVRGRIPTGWYPMDVAFVDRATVPGKDRTLKPQLWIVCAQGWGTQADPGGEWDGTYTGFVQHLVYDPAHVRDWNALVARNDRFAASAPPRSSLPPVKHVVFIVRENKQFDEEFADIAGTQRDPQLLLFGRHFTPNAHKLAQDYTLFDNLMTDGEASIYGHAWTTQAMANDYHERNAHARDETTADIAARVAWSIWPYPVAGEDTVPQAAMDFDWFRDLADLADGPRVNVSAIFGPRGELVDELARRGHSFRVYGEQLTMRPDGRIAAGLAAHAARDYPGAHIDFGVLDTDRAKLFLDDVAAHGLPEYTYLTLPTDHTAGTRAGFYTPASYVANNDVALGRIIAGLSRRADWPGTVVFVTCDDAQGTGDHVDSHRMPAFVVGPLVRRHFVSHAHYDQVSILRTVEVLFGLQPLNIHDAAGVPILDAFARQPDASAYEPLPANVSLEMNPGKGNGDTSFVVDGADAARIADEDWMSVRGALSLRAHRRYLAAVAGAPGARVAQTDDDE